jgi:hypothetical protein
VARFDISLSNPLWLKLARWLLVGYAVVLLSISIAGVLLFPSYASRHAADFTPNVSWTSAQVQTALSQLGWPATVPAYLELLRTLLMLVVGSGVGLLLLLRQARNWFLLYLAFVLISFAGGYTAILPVLSYLPALIDYRDFLGAASWQLFFILFYFFPNGQAVPGWTKWLALIWLASIPLSHYLSIQAMNLTLTLPLYLGLVISAIASQVYRFLRRSDPVQRQQTKWVVAAVGLMAAYLLLVAPWAFDPPAGPDLGLPLVISFVNLFVFAALFALVPLAIAIAIFKYRLWDIDLVIRRTLIYGLLSATLSLLFFGGVTLLQGLFTALSGQESPAALVLSTLLIAALFNPLRRRVQEFIDRRFYRGRYNAELVLQRFVEQARSQADLDQLAAGLVASVQGSLLPEKSSLWVVKIQDQRKGDSG